MSVTSKGFTIRVTHAMLLPSQPETGFACGVLPFLRLQPRCVFEARYNRQLIGAMKFQIRY